MPQIIIGDIQIDVVLKRIKNIHLSVHPPDGRVRISAPAKMDFNRIRSFAFSKIEWIKKKQKKIQNRVTLPPKQFITGETHFFLGKSYDLNVFEGKIKPDVVLNENSIDLYVKKNSDIRNRFSVLESWYRYNLNIIALELIRKWEKIMDVSIDEFRIKKMKTRWGTCNRKAKRIWLNSELAKRPIQSIEYIVVHELIHLLERNHNERFYALMTNFLPDWKSYRKELNSFPVSAENFMNKEVD